MPYSCIPPFSPSRHSFIGEVCIAEKPAAAISAIEFFIVLKSQQKACSIAPFSTFSEVLNSVDSEEPELQPEKKVAAYDIIKSDKAPAIILLCKIKRPLSIYLRKLNTISVTIITLIFDSLNSFLQIIYIFLKNSKYCNYKCDDV